ncbi:MULTISPECIES: hypothetical protein [Fibrobacter]|uniref:hypothetical protein n=1 Tax=Fibrobacter TaxID=832 RepID=UPI00130475C0|nr:MULTISPECIES: hypothetical protein [Fibrobacter]
MAKSRNRPIAENFFTKAILFRAGLREKKKFGAFSIFSPAQAIALGYNKHHSGKESLSVATSFAI